MTTLIERADELAAELTELRRDLHRHPELAFRETRTAAEVARRVEPLGFDVETGIARTGVIADLRNGDGPTIALRADMDALPIREANDGPYRSTVDGVMHACGHDAHVAMLVGAARLLASARSRDELPRGTIRLLFQPAEETVDKENKSGARRMVDEGALAGVHAIYGLHIGAHLPAGRVHVRGGPIMAGADAFTANVEGRSAHAARPHEGLDAIVLAAHAVLACQNAVARRIEPGRPGVLTIGRIRGGVAANVVADHVSLRGTIRYFDERVRGTLHRELRNAFAVVDALGGRAVVDVRTGNPPVVNDAALASSAREIAAGLFGAESVADLEPMMKSEDFAVYLNDVPGCLIWLGAALEPPREHHHPRFDIDERVLPAGAALLARLAENSLAAGGG